LFLNNLATRIHNTRYTICELRNREETRLVDYPPALLGTTRAGGYTIPTLYLISTATKQRVNIVLQKGILSVGTDVSAINTVRSVSAIRSPQSLDNKPSSSHINIRKDRVEWRTHFYRMSYFSFLFLLLSSSISLSVNDWYSLPVAHHSSSKEIEDWEETCGFDSQLFCFSAPFRLRRHRKSGSVKKVSTTSWFGNMRSEDHIESVVIKCVYNNHKLGSVNRTWTSFEFHS